MSEPRLAAAPDGVPLGNGKAGRDAPSTDRPAPGAGRFGMGIFLLSLAVLFLASLVAYVAIRMRADVWPPPDLPPLPRTLLVSTALIFAGSVTVQAAVACARANRRWALRVALLTTLLLGVAFLVSQAVGWAQMMGARTTPTSHLFGWLFYFLTGLHAAHVIGGLVPLGVVTVNAFYDRYSPLSHTGVSFSATYWHFLGGVWIALYATLALTV